MNPAIIAVLGAVIDKILPNKSEADQAKNKLAEMESNGELQRALAQIEVNKSDSQSSDPFTRRWRPFVGWVCGIGLSYQFILAPLLTFSASLYGLGVVAPELNIGDLITILLGLLGLGGLRTHEKINGVA